MKRVKAKNFKYDLFEPSVHKRNGRSVILYHGWGTGVGSNKDLVKEIADNGYMAIVPEIIYHDTRHPLENHFEKEIVQRYFWKTIFKSIDEFDEFFQELGIPKQNTVLIGSSMGGFIANGIFASQKNFGGLININGSGSFILSEKLFREMDNRTEIPIAEKQLLKKYDPVEQKNCDSPVLLIHGDSDQAVPIEGQQDYYRYLTEIETRYDADLLIYKNINHQITSEMVEDLIKWLNRFPKK